MDQMFPTHALSKYLVTITSPSSNICVPPNLSALTIALSFHVKTVTVIAFMSLVLLSIFFKSLM